MSERDWRLFLKDGINKEHRRNVRKSRMKNRNLLMYSTSRTRFDPTPDWMYPMCGRFTSLLSPELLNVIRAIFGITPPEQFQPRYNIAPTQQVWVIRSEGDHNRLELMKWGFVPSWAKDPRNRQPDDQRPAAKLSRSSPPFAIRSVTGAASSPISGFYEWSHAEEKKQPNFIPHGRRFADVPRRTLGSLERPRRGELA